MHGYLELLSRRAAEVLAQGTPLTYPASLAASCQLSFERLALDNLAALELLRLAAQLAAEPIPFALFTAHPDRLPEPLATAVSDPLTFAELTRLLRQRALARIGVDTLQLHRLIQAMLRTHPATATDTDPAGGSAIGLLRTAVPADPWNDTASWPVWRQLLPHVLAVTATRRDLDPGDGNIAWLLEAAASYLHARGEPRPALPLFQQAFQLCKERIGEDHPDTLTAANGLAGGLFALGNYEQARQLFADTFTQRCRILGQDHPDTLVSANGLAMTLGKLGQGMQAQPLFADTLARRRRVLGHDHPDTLSSAGNLAHNLCYFGAPDQARQLQEDTLTRYRRVLGDDHPHALNAASSVAVDLHLLGQHEQARQLQEDTLTRCRQVLGDDHPTTLASAINLTAHLRALGDYQRARELDEDTLTRYRRVLDDAHSATLASARSLATDLRALGHHDKAHELDDWLRSQRQC